MQDKIPHVFNIYQSMATFEFINFKNSRRRCIVDVVVVFVATLLSISSHVKCAVISTFVSLLYFTVERET